MAAFSSDIRQRVVDAYDANEGTQLALAARFKVSYSFVRKILRQRRLTGSIEPLPHGGGQAPAFDDQADIRLRAAVKADNDATLAKLASDSGVSCSVSAVCRALTRLEITRKKSLGGRPSKTSRS